MGDQVGGTEKNLLQTPVKIPFETIKKYQSFLPPDQAVVSEEGPNGQEKVSVTAELLYIMADNASASGLLNSDKAARVLGNLAFSVIRKIATNPQNFSAELKSFFLGDKTHLPENLDADSLRLFFSAMGAHKEKLGEGVASAVLASYRMGMNKALVDYLGGNDLALQALEELAQEEKRCVLGRWVWLPFLPKVNEQMKTVSEEKVAAFQKTYQAGGRIYWPYIIQKLDKMKSAQAIPLLAAFVKAAILAGDPLWSTWLVGRLRDHLRKPCISVEMKSFLPALTCKCRKEESRERQLHPGIRLWSSKDVKGFFGSIDLGIPAALLELLVGESLVFMLASLPDEFFGIGHKRQSLNLSKDSLKLVLKHLVENLEKDDFLLFGRVLGSLPRSFDYSGVALPNLLDEALATSEDSLDGSEPETKLGDDEEAPSSPISSDGDEEEIQLEIDEEILVEDPAQAVEQPVRLSPEQRIKDLRESRLRNLARFPWTLLKSFFPGSIEKSKIQESEYLGQALVILFQEMSPDVFQTLRKDNPFPLDLLPETDMQALSAWERVYWKRFLLEGPLEEFVEFLGAGNWRALALLEEEELCNRIAQMAPAEYWRLLDLSNESPYFPIILRNISGKQMAEVSAVVDSRSNEHFNWSREKILRALITGPGSAYHKKRAWERVAVSFAWSVGKGLQDLKENIQLLIAQVISERSAIAEFEKRGGKKSRRDVIENQEREARVKEQGIFGISLLSEISKKDRGNVLVDAGVIRNFVLAAPCFEAFSWIRLWKPEERQEVLKVFTEHDRTDNWVVQALFDMDRLLKTLTFDSLHIDESIEPLAGIFPAGPVDLRLIENRVPEEFGPKLGGLLTRVETEEREIQGLSSGEARKKIGVQAATLLRHIGQIYPYASMEAQGKFHTFVSAYDAENELWKVRDQLRDAYEDLLGSISVDTLGLVYQDYYRDSCVAFQKLKNIGKGSEAVGPEEKQKLEREAKELKARKLALTRCVDFLSTIKQRKGRLASGERANKEAQYASFEAILRHLYVFHQEREKAGDCPSWKDELFSRFWAFFIGFQDDQVHYELCNGAWRAFLQQCYQAYAGLGGEGKKNPEDQARTLMGIWRKEILQPIVIKYAAQQGLALGEGGVHSTMGIAKQFKNLALPGIFNTGIYDKYESRLSNSKYALALRDFHAQYTLEAILTAFFELQFLNENRGFALDDFYEWLQRSHKKENKGAELNLAEYTFDDGDQCIWRLSAFAFLLKVVHAAKEK